MRVLVLQFVPARGTPRPRYDPQLAVLLTLLRVRGHEVALRALDRFDAAALRAGFAAHLPQIVYADIHAAYGDVAQRTFGEIARREFLPIVAGGALASVAPQRCLSMPGVEAAALGEPDASLITYFERLRDPALSPDVPGIWRRDEQGLARPPMPALVEDLDSLPPGERALFDTAGQLRAGGQLEVAVGRGDPRDLGHTHNAALRALYALEDGADWVRRRSVDAVFEEIAGLRAAFEPVRTVRFRDRGFCEDREWLDEFLERWPGEVGLPFRCRLWPAAGDAACIRRLAAAGAYFADLEVISASEFIRADVFGLEWPGEAIEEAAGRVREHGMRSRGMWLLGAPYESEESLLAAGVQIERLGLDEVDVRAYFPMPGTAAAETCRENGWLHPRGEERFHRGRPGVAMPACPAAVIERALERLRPRRGWFGRSGEGRGGTSRG